MTPSEPPVDCVYAVAMRKGASDIIIMGNTLLTKQSCPGRQIPLQPAFDMAWVAAGIRSTPAHLHAHPALDPEPQMCKALLHDRLFQL